MAAWRGESVCVANKTVCKDEVVIYDIAKSGSDEVKISADKVVDGKRLNMGDLSCKERAGQDLVCAIPKGEWRFHVSGNRITGTINLTDGTIYRRVAVTKAD